MKNYKSLKARFSGGKVGAVLKFWDREYDVLDIILTAILLIFCYFSFMQSDLLITANRSFLMHTNFFDFYDACFEWTQDYGANYLPSTFLMFAIWNLPLRLFGRVPASLSTNALLNNMWFKMLPVLFYFATAVVIYKICILAGFGEKKAKICKYAFIVSPIAVFSQFIFSQYDIFTVFFMLLGVLYYLKQDKPKFVMFFAIAITFKYQALVYFVVFLLLVEKRIWAIIRDVVLVLIPLIIELAIYYPSIYFRKSVLGFSAVKYVEAGVDVGGQAPISLLLVVITILMTVAYVKKVKDHKIELFQWCLFLANGISFAFFGFTKFHPQWLLLTVPFMVMSILENKNTKFLLILQNLYIIVLYVMTVQIWPNNVDQQVFANSVFKSFMPSSWAIRMNDILKFDNVSYLFTCMWVLLLVYFIFSYPKFQQKDITVVEKETMGNIRIPFVLGVVLWAVPAFICLNSAIKGEHMVVENTNVETSMPLAVDESNTVVQIFTSNTNLLYEMDLYLGTYNRINNSEITLIIREAESLNEVYQTKVDLSRMINDNSWYKVIDDEIPLNVGEDYQIEISYEGPVGHNIAVYGNGKNDQVGDLLINEEVQPSSLVMKLKGRDKR